MSDQLVNLMHTDPCPGFPKHSSENTEGEETRQRDQGDWVKSGWEPEHVILFNSSFIILMWHYDH